jgi:hypothetical protein
MAKRFNYTLLALVALAGLFMGAGGDDLKATFDGEDLAFMFFGMMAMPSFLIFMSDYTRPINNLRPPDLTKWSLLPFQPLRFSLFFGSILFSIGLPGFVSVLVLRGIGPDLGMPIETLAIGTGLIVGTGIATWKYGDRLVSDDA